MNIKSTMLYAVATVSAILMASDTPEVVNVTMTQQSFGRQVIITYELANAQNGAVVTFDVETNRTGAVTDNDADWISIGGEAVCNARGAVWRKVTAADQNAQGKYTITWRPDLSWEGHKVDLADGGVRAVVTAWALDNTPDYMVVNLAADGTANTAAARCTFYPDVSFLPGPVLGEAGSITNNPDYRVSKLVMRKIMAKDVRWTMGSVVEPGRQSNETAHTVEIEDIRIDSTTGEACPGYVSGNYYIGVFEVTQGQWWLVAPVLTAAVPKFTVQNAMRPMDGVSYNIVRNAYTINGTPSSYYWPKSAPYSGSFIGRLRTLVAGIEFDLPSEAQWEFAARAGCGDGYWGDGKAIIGTTTDSNLNKLGRYKGNWESGSYAAAGDVPGDIPPTVGGTAVCGSYAPNKWGLYDMHGNVREWCLDWAWNDITPHGGKVNVDTDNPGNRLLVGYKPNASRIAKGGSWWDDAAACRAAYRSDNGSEQYIGYSYIGFRVVCPVGLQ